VKNEKSKNTFDNRIDCIAPIFDPLPLRGTRLSSADGVSGAGALGRPSLGFAWNGNFGNYQSYILFHMDHSYSVWVGRDTRGFVDIDVDILRIRYPDWHGALDLLEGISLYSTLLLCAVVAFCGAAYNTFRSGSMSKLVKKNLELDQKIGGIAENIHVLFENVLFSLVAKLKLDDAGSERVSIYVYMAEESAFVPCGRYSHNPVLKASSQGLFAE
jgi:hypothetical protein